ncbi:MAG: 50S ribosomal protein L11 methyltransferase [Pseudomonadota bacterium]
MVKSKAKLLFTLKLDGHNANNLGNTVLRVANMNPYENLYIYEIKGEVEDARSRFKEDFIGCWLEGGYSYLFFTEKKESEVRRVILTATDLEYISEAVLNYQDWEVGDKMVLFKVHNLLISPVWEHCVLGKDDIMVRLDPGVMFGSGYHPTTRKCLEALWKIYQWDCPRRVLDRGTGTGILGITAAKLGAREVLALDNKNLAVETSEKNVILNGVSKEVKAVCGDGLKYLDWGADLLCGNIHFEVMEELLKNEYFYT